jgi:hypothetical protein
MIIPSRSHTPVLADSNDQRLGRGPVVSGTEARVAQMLGRTDRRRPRSNTDGGAEAYRDLELLVVLYSSSNRIKDGFGLNFIKNDVVLESSKLRRFCPCHNFLGASYRGVTSLSSTLVLAPEAHIHVTLEVPSSNSSLLKRNTNGEVEVTLLARRHAPSSEVPAHRHAQLHLIVPSSTSSRPAFIVPQHGAHAQDGCRRSTRRYASCFLHAVFFSLHQYFQLTEQMMINVFCLCRCSCGDG